MSQALDNMRAKIARFGLILVERKLTDIAGGNISARVGDQICITARYSGSKHQWRIKPEEVLVTDLEGNVLEGQGEISRESKVHFRLYREFSEHGSSVIHAHARNVLVFAAMNCPMPPVLEANLKFGTVPVVKFAAAHSSDLAENIAGAIRGQEARIRKHAAAAIAPWHGLFVMGKDLDATLDAVERMDTNAYCILMAQALGGVGMLDEQREQLVAAARAYGKE